MAIKSRVAIGAARVRVNRENWDIYFISNKVSNRSYKSWISSILSTPSSDRAWRLLPSKSRTARWKLAERQIYWTLSDERERYQRDEQTHQGLRYFTIVYPTHTVMKDEDFRYTSIWYEMNNQSRETIQGQASTGIANDAHIMWTYIESISGIANDISGGSARANIKLIYVRVPLQT